MHFNKVGTTEIAFKNSSAFTFKAFSIPVKNEPQLLLEGFTCRRKDGLGGYFFNEKIKKERIVLHYTAGHLKGDMATLTKHNYHVSVPFVIARDGTIYQLFSSGAWSYHLGPGAIGGNKNQSQKTIAIELSNYGFLNKNGTQLETIYSSAFRPDVYCSTNDTALYKRLTRKFRGENYYATFTDAQYESLIILLRYLTALYDIPRAFLPVAQRYDTFHGVTGFRGIVSHVNYRVSGKWDIGPAFDWDRMIAGTTAPGFAPLGKHAAEIATAKEELEDAKADLRAAQAVLQDAKKAVEKARRKVKFLEESAPKSTKSKRVPKNMQNEKGVEGWFDKNIKKSRKKADAYGEDGPETGYNALDTEE